MAQGDITKEIEYDKIEVVNTWNIQVRQATKIMEEQADGSKKELTRSFHRHVLQPFSSAYKTKLNSDGKTTSPDLDADGKIISKNLRGLTLHQQLDKLVKSL